MEPTGFDRHRSDHSDPSPQGALPSARMSTEEVLKASNGLTSERAFFEYRAKLMSTPHIEEQGEPIHCLVKIGIDAGDRRSRELLKQEARDLILFSVNPRLHP